MKKLHLLFYSICLSFISKGQINLIGHTLINNTPVKQVNITIQVDGVITKTLNTQSKSEFKIQLDYGKVFSVFVITPST